jgi:hypothetical protein
MALGYRPANHPDRPVHPPFKAQIQICRRIDGATAMATFKTSKPRPAPWAVALFVLSSGFTLMVMVLVGTGFTPG